MHGFMILLIDVVIICLFYPLFCGALLTIHRNKYYKIVDLENNMQACRKGENTLQISADEPALIRLGHSVDTDSADVESCELQVLAPRGFGISMTVTKMNLDFHRNEFTGEMTCHDYIRFTRQRDSFLARLMARVIKVFEDRSSKICRREYKINNHRPELYYVGKTANIFYALKNRIGFHYHRDQERGSRKQFTVVATAFRAVNGTCPNEYIRCGIESMSFCISDVLRCDSHINCGFPSSGVDEQGCDGDEWRIDGAMSTHTLLWVTLVLTLAVFVCCLVSCAVRCWGGPRPSILREMLTNSSGAPAPASAATSSSGAPASAGDRRLPVVPSPLPSYDSVVRHLNHGPEAPPAYKDLFPEPPPTPPGAQRIPLTAYKRSDSSEPSAAAALMHESSPEAEEPGPATALVAPQRRPHAPT